MMKFCQLIPDGLNLILKFADTHLNPSKSITGRLDTKDFNSLKGCTNWQRVVLTLTRRCRLITLRGEKQVYLFERPNQNQRGSNSGRMHDWRGSQALYQGATGRIISIVVISQPIILYTINPPVSDMLVPAPSTPKYIPFRFKGLVSGMHHWRHQQIKDSD